MKMKIFPECVCVCVFVGFIFVHWPNTSSVPKTFPFADSFILWRGNGQKLCLLCMCVLVCVFINYLIGYCGCDVCIWDGVMREEGHGFFFIHQLIVLLSTNTHT